MRKRLGFVFWLAVVYLVVLAVAAVFADVLPIKDPAETFPGTSKQGPSLSHWFGNDGVGRDVFSRVIYGAQVSLVISTVGTVLALIIGGLVGMVAGVLRQPGRPLAHGHAQRVVGDPAAHPVPGIGAVLGLRSETAHLHLGLHLRAAVDRSHRAGGARRHADLGRAGLRARVQDARGARDGRVLFREILPNVAPSFVSYSLIIMAGLIVVEARWRSWA